MDLSDATHKRLKSIYSNMKQRCENLKRKDYEYYGGKGIKVYPPWKVSFTKFCVWALTNGYTNKLTLDRIDIDKDYCPENCRWVDMAIQRRNHSQLVMVTINHKTMCLKDWCNHLNLDYRMVYMRYKRGKSVEEALGIEQINLE